MRGWQCHAAATEGRWCKRHVVSVADLLEIIDHEARRQILSDTLMRTIRRLRTDQTRCSVYAADRLLVAVDRVEDLERLAPYEPHALAA